MLSDEEVRRIALTINDLIDLPYWNEEQEQELLECTTSRCAESIAKALPAPYFDLMHTDAGLERDQARELGDNLVRLCISECSLPFMDEHDKRRVVRGVVWTLVAAMKRGHELRRFTVSLHEDSRAQEIIVNVLMQGALDVFFEKDMRVALARDMSWWIKVPFVPRAALQWSIESLLVRFTGSLQVALKRSFREYRAACAERRPLRVTPMEACSELEVARVLRLYQGRPFIVQLRRAFVEQIVDDRFGRGLFRVALQRPGVWLLSRFVDLVFKHLPGVDKIERSVQVLHAVEDEPSCG